MAIDKPRTLKDVIDPYLPRKKHIVPVLEMMTGIYESKKGEKGSALQLAASIPVAGSLVRAKSGLSYLKKLVNMKKKGVNMESFFSGLGWNKGAENLWHSIQSLNVKILTGGKDLADDAISLGKKGWVKNNLKLSSKDVIIETKKDIFASPNSVLIDDAIENIRKFKKAGGKAILHKNEKKTIKRLNEMVKENPNLKVYVDLDGVLVDLKGGIKKFKLGK